MATLSPDALAATAAELANAGAKPISREAACHLLRADDDMLPSLLAAAQLARARFKPGVITYSRKVFLPLTNLCRDYCGYCTFRRDPGTPGAHTMTPDEVMEVVRAGERMGCTEALFSLGDKPELAFSPDARYGCGAGDTNPRSIIWKRCARRCFANRVCCPIPIPG